MCASRKMSKTGKPCCHSCRFKKIAKLPALAKAILSKR